MARLNLGGRYVTAEAVADWKTAHGYDQPLFYNVAEKGTGKITKTLFWSKSVPLLTGDLGMTDAGRSINEDVRERAPASLALAVPTFVMGVAVMLVFSLLLVWVRRTGWETAGVVTSIGIMSVSSLFLHHSRSVALCQDAALGTGFGLCRRHRHGAFFGPSRGDCVVFPLRG